MGESFDSAYLMFRLKSVTQPPLRSNGKRSTKWVLKTLSDSGASAHRSVKRA